MEANARPAPEARPPGDVGANATKASSTAGRTVLVAVLAAAIGGAAGYFLKPPPIVETDFVNFDQQSTPPAALGDGWSKVFEQFKDGVSFCWCSATRCTLNVSSAAKGDRVVVARLTPLHYEGAPPQVITAYINGTKIGSQPVPPDVLTTLTFPASRQYWLPGQNALTFEFAYAKDPKSVIPGAEDARVLAAAFDWVEIVPK
jgi:hypothetical protein